jgi:hypothetical protein
LQLEDERAIELAKSRSDARALVDQMSSAGDASVSRWYVSGRFTDAGEAEVPELAEVPKDPYAAIVAKAKQLLPPTPQPHEYPVREVWYASTTGDGYHRHAWEVHLDTGEVFPVSGGAALEANYYAIPEPRPSVQPHSLSLTQTANSSDDMR